MNIGPIKIVCYVGIAIAIIGMIWLFFIGFPSLGNAAINTGL